jgi:hypothetical protein
MGWWFAAFYIKVAPTALGCGRKHVGLKTGIKIKSKITIKIKALHLRLGG